MPGIVGFTLGAHDGFDPRKTLEEMRDLITHREFYSKDELFCDDSICATRVQTGNLQSEAQPYSKDGLHIWLYGEFYNQTELSSRYSVQGRTDAELLHALYSEQPDTVFLKSIDGVFSALIYDCNRKQLLLIADRYGLKHLYFAVRDDRLIWGSEAKAVLAFPGLEPVIDRPAVQEFVNIGYLLENRTWFEGVELVPSGTVIRFDLKDRSVSKERYWWWSEIGLRTGKIDENEVAEEVGRLLIESVRRRSKAGEHVGLTLSGGLDSRICLAALPNYGDTVNALTFGQDGCDDIEIASSVAKIYGASYHTSQINAENWLEPRVEAVWWTDGEMDLQHMHGVESLPARRELFKIGLNGFAGGQTSGGRLLGSKGYFETPINRELASKTMGCSADLLWNVDQYADLQKSDYYFLQNRMRRFIMGGPRYVSTHVEQRLPFYDNELLELIYSLPDSMRFRSRIYIKALLLKYPEYFKNIPWQSTGVPISWPENLVEAITLAQKCTRKGMRILTRFGLPWCDKNNYVNYAEWIRTGNARDFFSATLESKNALYQRYLSRERVLDEWNRHLRGEDFVHKLCRYLTIEIWLQQCQSRLRLSL